MISARNADRNRINASIDPFGCIYDMPATNNKSDDRKEHVTFL